VYLGRQNVSLDLGRFSETLARLQRWRQVSSRPQRCYGGIDVAVGLECPLVSRR
jgi:hypothetical protein